MLLDIVRLTFFPALVAFAAASDLFTMTISNRISLLLILGFVLLATVSGMSLRDVTMHAAAAALVLVATFACFAMGWLGGGDAKLAAAIALWFGFDHLLEYFVYATVFGGALTLLILQFRQWPLPRMALGQGWLHRLHETNGGIPYGIALAIGALMIYPDTAWMKVVDIGRLTIG